MQEIFSRIGDFQVNFSNLNSRLFSVFGTFLFTRKILLRFLQTLSMFLEMLGISYLVTIAGRNQTRYSQIYSYRIVANGQRLNRWSIKPNRDVPTDGWRLTVKLLGSHPLGICLDHLIGNGSEFLAI